MPKRKLVKRDRKIFTIKERKEIIKTHGSVCYLCQRNIDLSSLWHIDHIKPFSKSGSDDIENLRPTHKVCNELKGAKSINLVRLAAVWEKRNA
jgi:5-methylcytosine-specific restriction endonuclease McrA